MPDKVFNDPNLGAAHKTRLREVVAGGTFAQEVVIAQPLTGAQIMPMTERPETANGATPFLIAAGGLTALTVVRNVPAGLYGMSIMNPGAATGFLDLFNATTVAGVTLGTTVPLVTIPVPAGQAVTIMPSGINIPFAAGIVAAFTGTYRGAAVAAVGLVGTLFYF